MQMALRFRKVIVALCLQLFALSICASCSNPPDKRSANGSGAPEGTVQQRHSAPDLGPNLPWLNADRAYAIQDFRGQILVLDFWTYCCINCMHVLPVLSRVEERFSKQPVAVVGVHSAKFSGERDPQRILDAMRRYGVKHPVLVDSDMQVWKAYGVRAWPTLILVKPDGTVAETLHGEVSEVELSHRIHSLLEEGRRKRTLSRKPLFVPKMPEVPTGPLLFPGKLSALSGGQFAVADSGHHRILVVDASGNVVQTVGAGTPGFRDGPFESAQFFDPQGIASDGKNGLLYIADTKNHRIRRIDLRARRVSTIAGSGRLGHGPLEFTAQPAHKLDLRSPWDVAVSANGRILWIALAGSHQIGVMDLQHATLNALAGTGREALRDGTFEDADFAQPSGLSVSGETLVVADSESSAVRRLDLRKKSVTTLIGKGLFEFGDRNGALDSARLQHPLHVLALGRDIWVADTYNHAIKKIVGRRIERVSKPALDLREPGGLTRDANGDVWIADTGHHRLVRIDNKRNHAESVILKNAEKSSPTLSQKHLIKLMAPKDHEMSSGSPIDVALFIGGSEVAKHSAEASGGKYTTFPIEIPEKLNTPTVQLEISAVLCDARDHAYCTPIAQKVTLSAGKLLQEPWEVALELPVK